MKRTQPAPDYEKKAAYDPMPTLHAIVKAEPTFFLVIERRGSLSRFFGYNLFFIIIGINLQK
jgi:hypothetical protein